MNNSKWPHIGDDGLKAICVIFDDFFKIFSDQSANLKTLRKWPPARAQITLAFVVLIGFRRPETLDSAANCRNYAENLCNCVED
jgi:hypothetical protein